MKAKRSKMFQPIMLSLVVSGLMYGATLPQAYANDLDIYRKAVEGKATLVLMLDTSGSMGSDFINEDFPGACGTLYTENSGTTPNYVRRYCIQSGNKRYDRISRLQDALFTLMDDPSVKEGIVMGLGQYSSQTRADGTSMSADGRSGKITVPARALGPVGSAHRNAIKTAVAAMVASGGTPTAHAYAEAASYLMGTNTGTQVTRDRYRRYLDGSNRVRYNNCSAYNALNTTTGRVTCATWSTTALTSQPSTYVTTTYTSGTTIVYAEPLADNLDSGFAYSASSTISGGDYLTPLPQNSETAECDGQGIYFLTDGEPNTSSTTRASTIMSRALGTTFTCPSSGARLSGGSSDGAWNCIGEFAKRLYNKDNPAQVQIKTAVVGFGSVYEGIEKFNRQRPDNASAFRDYYDCNAATVNQNAKNACNWGELVHPTVPTNGGYGQGGFYSAKTVAEVVDSIKKFIQEVEPQIKAVPAGAVVVPQDTLAPDSLQPYAYLPLMLPRPGTTDVVWSGNVKKYDVEDGTIKGGNGQLVFDSQGSFATNTYDRWSNTVDGNGNRVADGGKVDVGGVFGRLPMPTATNTLGRNVWLERSAANKILDPVKPNLLDINALVGVTNWQRRYLLNFLGYDLPEIANTLNPSSLLDLANVLPATLQRPTEPFKVMGGVVHSTPQLMTYSASLNEDGSLGDSRNESLLFGSLEGALHVVNADTGVEQLAFIPRQILDKQPRALRPSTTGSMTPVSNVSPTPTAYGVDAPWTAYAEYTRKTSKLEADFMYAYGGLRMGGDAFYGLDLTSLSSPKILFNITPATSGFSRLGQTWGKPVVTRIRYNNEVRLVVIFTGGYDLDYEKEDKDRSTTTAVKGNAVYIVDAKTGERLLTVSQNGQGGQLTSPDLKYSVVSRVKTLDRDADGLTDHLYFADLGGQVFRVDLQNTPNTTAANFGTRVVRLANLTGANGAGTPGPRFYEAPVVTIHDEGSKRFAVVNVGSGDRSNPLYEANNTPNRIYGIIDRDVARPDLYSASVTMYSQNIELGSLIEKPSSATHKAAMLSDAADRKNGWYYPLDAYGTIKSGLKGLKAFNEGAAIRNDLYIAVYNPNVINATGDKCSAQVLGGTELNRYCLPFGICSDGNNRQRFNLGQGIQAVNFGPGDDPQTRRLIYQRPTTSVVNQETGTALNQHREYSTPPRLVPIRWYEKQPKLNP